MTSLQTNSVTMAPGLNNQLANELNEEMKSTVMPVTVFVGLEAVFGFCGNILILYVFIFHYHKCNFKYLVLCLSFVDTTSTLTTLPGEIVTQTFWYVYPVPMVCKIKSFFNVFTVCGSAFALLVISIDRFRKVCRPLQWQIKPRHSLALIVVQLMISFIIALPVAFFWGTHSFQKLYKGHNITLTVCEIDAKYLKTDYPLKYSVVTETILAITMLLMFILYVYVCRKLLSTKSFVKKKASPEDMSQNPRSSGAAFSGGVVSDDDHSFQGQSVEPQDTADSTSCSRGVDIAEGDKAAAEFSLQSKVSNKSSTLTTKRSPSTRVSRKKKIRRKTLIMFILTAVFIFTTVLYLTLLSLIANGVLESLTKGQRSIYFFFFRLYFINHVINPILYGILDPKFRRILKQTVQSVRSKCFRCARRLDGI